jgi:hypothetical protein
MEEGTMEEPTHALTLFSALGLDEPGNAQTGTETPSPKHAKKLRGAAAAPKEPKPKAMSTQRLEAYQEAVTSHGFVVKLGGREKVAEVLDRWEATDVTLETIRATVAMMCNWTPNKPIPYSLEQAANDVLTYRARYGAPSAAAPGSADVPANGPERAGEARDGSLSATYDLSAFAAPDDYELELEAQRQARRQGGNTDGNH